MFFKYAIWGVVQLIYCVVLTGYDNLGVQCFSLLWRLEIFWFKIRSYIVLNVEGCFMKTRSKSVTEEGHFGGVFFLGQLAKNPIGYPTKN